MSAHCCPVPDPAVDPRYRRILWIALAVNAAMFLVEIAAGLQAILLSPRFLFSVAAGRCG